MNFFFLSTIMGICGFSNPKTQNIKHELTSILEYYQKYDLPDYKLEINEVLEKIERYEDASDISLLNEIRENFYRIRFGQELVLSIAREQDQNRGAYFDIWSEVAYLKKRVDNLYVSNVTVRNVALNIENKSTKIRKKSIYHAYTNIYEFYITRLKMTNECDYSAKTAILTKVKPILEKSEKLLSSNDTKLLEKELKNITESTVLEKKLMAWIIG
ncbi:MAG: hypothetical protein GY816_00390 [Cytophagales bacterium]|nr:hypothetical protein [Cytophagales bacterium]